MSSRRVQLAKYREVWLLTCFIKFSQKMFLWNKSESNLSMFCLAASTMCFMACNYSKSIIIQKSSPFLINWACRRLAQVIKYLRFLSRGVSLAIRGGDVSPHSLNPDCRLYFSNSDQYLQGKCKQVPTGIFGSVNGLYQWLTEQSGVVFLGT